MAQKVTETLVSLVEITLTKDFLNHTEVIDKIADILRNSETLDVCNLVEQGKHLNLPYYYILDLNNLSEIHSAYKGLNWDENFTYVLDFIFEYLEMVNGLKAIRRWNSSCRIFDPV